MGGLVGENDGTVANSFTNGVYNYIGTTEQEDPTNDPDGLFRYVGGLVGRNHHWAPGTDSGTFTYGTVNNCYVRFQRDNSLINNVQFGLLVGTNEANSQNGTITNCYFSQAYNAQNLVAAGNATDCDNNYYTDPVQPSIRWQRSNDNVVGGTLETETYYIDSVLTQVGVWKNGTALVDKLNENKGNYATWSRTTAGNYYTSLNGGNINGDYPVLMLEGFTCLASTDGIALDYATSLDEMLERHNVGALNVNTALPGEGSGYNGSSTHNYHVAPSDLIYGATINLYDNDEVTKSTTENTMVYINENVSLLQGETSNIDAYTGQWIIDYGSNYNPQSGDRWHNVSSSLQNSGFGWTYHEEGIIQHNWEPDPCRVWLQQANDDNELFPIDMASPNPFDFYCFYEKEYHWINFKRNSLSHWHMNAYDINIPYPDQETQFIPGKGYLLALHTEYFDDMHFWTESESNKKDRTFLQNRGTLNNGEITIPVTYTEANEWSGLSGYNLLGNPYQSYLDFTAFAWENSSLWDNASQMTYGIYDPYSHKYVQGTAGEQPSRGALAATGDINMHQGFFIRVNKSTGGNGEAKFTNAMRSNEPAYGTHFRGNRASYPLINFILNDEDGNDNIAVLEVGRPTYGGAQKLRLGSCKGRISLRHDNEDYGILFSEMTEGSQPLWFRAEENGVYTLSWNTANANFQELTLVDNITGVTVDMLTHDSYRFEGLVDQYRSRFKVVIGKFTGIEEQEDGASTGSATFAFFDGSEWVVNGQGSLDVVDVMGRTVYSSQLTDSQSRVNLNSLAQGVYVLRMASGNELKTQKIIIQ